MLTQDMQLVNSSLLEAAESRVSVVSTDEARAPRKSSTAVTGKTQRKSTRASGGKLTVPGRASRCDVCEPCVNVLTLCAACRSCPMLSRRRVVCLKSCAVCHTCTAGHPGGAQGTGDGASGRVVRQRVVHLPVLY